MTYRKLARIHGYSRVKAVLAPFEWKAYLSTTQAPKINVGCGKNILAGWLNADLYPHPGAIRMDAAHRWPVGDGCFAACLCEHMIEHVPKATAIDMISEIFRTLRPGGVLRVVTPDLTTFAQIALDDASPVAAEYLGGLRRFLGNPALSTCDAVNEIFYGHGHRFIYSPTELSKLLRNAGFRELQETRGGLHFDPVFEGVDGHPKTLGKKVNEIEAFAIEARK